ncbi:MAG: bifunctional nuclease family protein [Anaerolineae bacterium]|nr:bifunctional nuclease family protein [Anaerolineae bacterium]
MSVEVRIAGLVTEDRDRRVVLLDEAGRRALPVWVWWESYWSIDIALRKFPLRQPTISQFVTRLLEATGATLERVTITEYLHIDLYASAALRKDGVAWEMDIGPSDALALAAWGGCPIYVAEAVMDMFAVPVQGAGLRRRRARTDRERCRCGQSRHGEAHDGGGPGRRGHLHRRRTGGGPCRRAARRRRHARAQAQHA